MAPSRRMVAVGRAWRCEPHDSTVVGVPAHRTSLSPTGAHATPQAIRAALVAVRTYAADAQASRCLRRCATPATRETSRSRRGRSRNVVRRRGAHQRGRADASLLGGDNSITYARTLGSLRSRPFPWGPGHPGRSPRHSRRRQQRVTGASAREAGARPASTSSR